MAAILVPLLAAEPALADSQPTVADILKMGSDTTCTHGDIGQYQNLTIPDGTCLQFKGYSTGANSDSWAGFDVTGSPGALPTGTSIFICYLTSDNGGTVYCTYSTLTTSEETSHLYGAPDGVQAHAYWANWSETPVGTGAGTLCMSLDSHRCNQSQSSGDGLGAPNSNEIGHPAFDGTYSAGPATLPGQQADGSVDPVACIGEINNDAVFSGAFDPLAFIFAPVKCVFLWAFTPPTSMVTDFVTQENTLWVATMPGKIIDSVDFYSAITFDTSCDGLTIPTAGLRVPGGPPISDIHILKACAGDQLEPLSGLVNIGLTLAVLIGGTFKLLGMISGFLHGPRINPEGGDVWEDTRLF